MIYINIVITIQMLDDGSVYQTSKIANQAQVDGSSVCDPKKNFCPHLFLFLSIRPAREVIPTIKCAIPVRRFQLSIHQNTKQYTQKEFIVHLFAIFCFISDIWCHMVGVVYLTKRSIIDILIIYSLFVHSL